jgi:pyridoxamine 5'-phosphate oxidase
MNDPLTLLAADRQRARAAGDPWANLCVLATVSGSRPEVRTLVLRDVHDRLAVFVNATSPKQAQIEQNPEVAVLLYLATCSVQYRLTAVLEPIAPAVVHANWRARPRIPKVMDWFYREHLPQSTAIDSRETLESLHGEVDQRIGADPHAPTEALGHYVTPSVVERLELASDRIHDRRRFVRRGDAWQMDILVP